MRFMHKYGVCDLGKLIRVGHGVQIKPWLWGQWGVCRTVSETPQKGCKQSAILVHVAPRNEIHLLECQHPNPGDQCLSSAGQWRARGTF